MKFYLMLFLLAGTAIYMASADIARTTRCCTKVSSKKPGPEIQIVKFYIQPESLPCVEAVMFMTNTPKIICAKPNTPWVKKKQQELRKKEEDEENKKTKENVKEH